MAPSTNPAAEKKKLSLDETAEKIADEYPAIFVDADERHMLKEDFKLLVCTYVMDDGTPPLFATTKQRRLVQIGAYDRVKKYNSKAKAAGSSSLQERAKSDAEGRDIDDVDNFDEMAQMMSTHPETVKKVTGDIMAKLMGDMKDKKWWE